MIRIRMIATAFLILAAMPGCGIFHKDRPCFPRLHAFFCGDKSDSTVGYQMLPTGGGVPCETCSNPGGGVPMMTGPIISNPGVTPQIPQSQNIPNPKIGIKESDGKQFDLESNNKTGGPILGMPAVGTKMN